MARRRSLFSRPRRTLYSAARTLGDLSAIQGEQWGERIVRRLVGKETGRMMGRLFG